MAAVSQVIRKYASAFDTTRPVDAVSLAGKSTYYNLGAKKDKPEWVILNEFRSMYFSGLDISVYAGGVFLDEVVQLQFSEMEQVRPLFGYQSYTFDSVVHGARIVQGSFAINFKDAGYIPQLLSRMDNLGHVVRAAQKMESEPTQGQEHLKSVSKQDDWPATRYALSNDITLEDFVNIQSGNRRNTYVQLGYANVMDDLKERYWGKATPAVSAESDSSDRRPKYQPPLPGFDLVIKYGQPEDYSNGRPGWGTIEVIKDCHITNLSKSIDDSGRNVLEVYQFMAKTID